MILENIPKKTVAVEYFDCGIAAHRHKTAAHAMKCINAYQAPKRVLWGGPRLAALLQKHEDGAIQAVLAREYGLSSTRIAQLLNKDRRNRNKAQA